MSWRLECGSSIARSVSLNVTRFLLVVVFTANADAESWCDAPPAPELASLKQADVQDDWFKTYAVAPGVFAITEPRQLEGVNSFLIVGSKRAVLFDSGLGVGRMGNVVKKLTALPVTVLNSHTHFDHVGGNREFEDARNLDEAFSTASARGEISEELRSYAKDTLAEDRVCGSLPAGTASRDYVIPTWSIAAHVRDGERLDLGDRTVEVLRTPGHTPDSMCLLDAANGLLFTGDTYYSGEVFLWAPETVVADYTASIARLVRLAPDLKLLLPAHGPPLADPRQLIELQKALQDIDAGTVRSETTASGRRLFKFEHFSILMNGPG
jgi:glyoxylase-like metal-dependent hydrolase (beta-lactamase superfamily II)